MPYRSEQSRERLNVTRQCRPKVARKDRVEVVANGCFFDEESNGEGREEGESVSCYYQGRRGGGGG